MFYLLLSPDADIFLMLSACDISYWCYDAQFHIGREREKRVKEVKEKSKCSLGSSTISSHAKGNSYSLKLRYYRYGQYERVQIYYRGDMHI